MVISHNLSAININRMYGIVSRDRSKTTEKLSSGYRINRAADDAAGLAISEKMRKQIRSLNQGISNIMDGISVCQIMDGALVESHDILHRMTELSVKAANGTLSLSDRHAVQQEINELISEFNHISINTKFNEKHLLSPVKEDSDPNIGKAEIVFVIDNTGSMGGMVNNVKENLSAFSNALTDCDVRYGVVEFGDTAREVKPYSFVSSAEEIKDQLGKIVCSGGGDINEAALDGIMESLRFPFRSKVKEIVLVTDAPFHDKNGDGLSTYTASDVANALKKCGARLSVVTTSANMDKYASELATGNVLNINIDFYKSLTVLAEEISDSANREEEKAIDDIPIQMSGDVNDKYILHTFNVTAEKMGLDDINVSTVTGALSAIDSIDKASSRVAEIRAIIGADQNCLEHAYKSNLNTSENTQAAESKIRDTDMAKEMVAFANRNILMQAGEAMLAQANQSNQGVLSLLK